MLHAFRRLHLPDLSQRGVTNVICTCVICYLRTIESQMQNWTWLTGRVSFPRFWKLVRKCPLGNCEIEVKWPRGLCIQSSTRKRKDQESACNRRSEFESRIACKHSTSDFRLPDQHSRLRGVNRKETMAILDIMACLCAKKLRERNLNISQTDFGL